MKKFAFIISFAFLFLVTSCNFFEAPVEPKNGSIVIDLGNKSRHVDIIDSDTVEIYKIQVRGSNYSNSFSAGARETLYIEDLPAGSYTINAYAVKGNNIVSSASTTVTVEGLETTEAFLVFKKDTILNTRFGMFNYYPSNNTYGYSPFDSIDELNLDITGRKPFDTTSYHSFYEMPDSYSIIVRKDSNNGTLFKIIDDRSSNYYEINEALLFNIDYIVSDPYDTYLNEENKLEYTISVLTLGTTNSNRTPITFRKYNKLDNFMYNPGSAYANSTGTFLEIYSIISVVKYFSDYFIVYKPTEYGTARLAWVRESEEEGKLTLEFVNDFGASDLSTSFTDTTEIRDIVMPKKGELYAIVGENGSVQSYDDEGTWKRDTLLNRVYSLQTSSTVTVEGTEFYNRGAVLKLNCDFENSRLSAVGDLGWYSKRRTLTAKGTFQLYEDSGFADLNGDAAYNELERVDLYAPSKNESSKYFYGPVRFICTKPDEVYIVDSGFNMRLADWTATDNTIANDSYDKNQKGLTSNIFNHERIIKVNLNTFAMSVEKETVSSLLYTDSSFVSGNSPNNPSIKSFFLKNSNLGFTDSNKYVMDKFGNSAVYSDYLGIHPNPVEPLD